MEQMFQITRQRAVTKKGLLICALSVDELKVFDQECIDAQRFAIKWMYRCTFTKYSWATTTAMHCTLHRVMTQFPEFATLQYGNLTMFQLFLIEHFLDFYGQYFFDARDHLFSELNYYHSKTLREYNHRLALADIKYERTEHKLREPAAQKSDVDIDMDFAIVEFSGRLVLWPWPVPTCTL